MGNLECRILDIILSSKHLSPPPCSVSYYLGHNDQKSLRNKMMVMLWEHYFWT